MSVKVEALTKIYGQQKAVDNISFEVNTGEIVGFLGPNGAGKSTTMKMITGYLEPTAGQAEVCGTSIFKDPVGIRRHIGYLPEHNPLYLEMYVKEYLEFSGKMHGMGKGLSKRIAEMIELTGLGKEQHKKLRQLSKGYRQRAGLAQAMLHDPEVLILDEPTTGLDPNQIVEIRELIKQVGQSKTVILSTHIMQEVQAMCQRVMILNQGKIVVDDSTQNIQNRISGTAALKIEFKEPINKEKIERIRGVDAVILSDGGRRCLVQFKSKKDVRENIFNLAVELKNPILHMEPIVESLEDLFRQLTKSAAS